MFGLDIKAVLIGMLIVATAAFIFAISLLSNVLSIKDAIGDWLFAPTTATVTSSRTIVTSLQPLGQVVSLRVEVAQADIFVSVNTGGLNLCGHSANHVAQGVIEAGVDISQVSESSVSYDEVSDTYTLSLPAPQITSCRIEYIRQYEQAGGNPTCGIDWDNVRLLGQYAATVQFAEDTLEGGITERAQRETTLLMQSFIEALTGSNVVVVYGEANPEQNLPASCHPQLPRGWSLNAETGEWVQLP